MWNELTPKGKKIALAIIFAVISAIAAKFGLDLNAETGKALDTIERSDKLFSGAVTE